MGISVILSTAISAHVSDPLLYKQIPIAGPTVVVVPVRIPVPIPVIATANAIVVIARPGIVSRRRVEATGQRKTNTMM